jgi:hypothetical protein
MVTEANNGTRGCTGLFDTYVVAQPILCGIDIHSEGRSIDNTLPKTVMSGGQPVTGAQVFILGTAIHAVIQSQSVRTGRLAQSSQTDAGRHGAVIRGINELINRQLITDAPQLEQLAAADCRLIHCQHHRRSIA